MGGYVAVTGTTDGTTAAGGRSCWLSSDRVMPKSYADKFARAVTGRSEIRVIPDAGHLAELDKPDEVAAAIIGWTA